LAGVSLSIILVDENQRIQLCPSQIGQRATSSSTREKSFVSRRKAHAAVILLSAPVILVSIRVALTGGSICVRLVVYKNNAGHKAKAHHNLYAHLCMWMQHLENHPEKCESQPTGFQLRRRHRLTAATRVSNVTKQIDGHPCGPQQPFAPGHMRARRMARSMRHLCQNKS
jgi:hypothetical protein